MLSDEYNDKFNHITNFLSTYGVNTQVVRDHDVFEYVVTAPDEPYLLIRYTAGYNREFIEINYHDHRNFTFKPHSHGTVQFGWDDVIQEAYDTVRAQEISKELFEF